MARMGKHWSYSTGIRGVSKVRVFERAPGKPLHIDFTGGERQTLTNLTGVPILDKKIAQRVADSVSKRLEEEATGTVARDVLGLPEQRTLDELLQAYHRNVSPTWSHGHKRHQDRMRLWWRARLGGDTPAQKITEADVERAIRKTDTEWAPRTQQKHLRYIMAVFRYAHRKLRWIEEKQNLSGVDVPKPDEGGPAYSHEEILLLLQKAPAVDPRVSAALEIAYDTQARSRAILHLTPGDYLGDGLLRFRKATDKAKKERVAVLSTSGRNALEALLQPDQPWVFMEAGEQMNYDFLLRLLREVEVAAGVPHVPARGWHAVKRRAVTDARRAVGDMGAVSKQSGTLTTTLERVYDQDDMEPKRKVAEAMEALRHPT